LCAEKKGKKSVSVFLHLDLAKEWQPCGRRAAFLSQPRDAGGHRNTDLPARQWFPRHHHHTWTTDEL